MALEPLLGLIGVGAFGIVIIGGLLFGVIEFLGRIYGTYRCLARKDLATEQRIIYFLLIWVVPLGWLIYFILGTERTQRLFSDLDFV